MVTLLGGAAMVGAGVGAIAVCRARGGEPHWLIKLPGMETTVALVIVCLFAGGIAMMTSWFLG